MRFRAERKDATHAPIAKRFIAHGCTVVTLPAAVGGLPDLLVGCARANHLVEVKNPETGYGRAGPSAVQAEWAAAWRGERPSYVSTEAEVDDLVRLWRTVAPRP